ncbi:MAG: DNA methyltransferase [Candidatus Peregrinibacteria bacterium]
MPAAPMRMSSPRATPAQKKFQNRLDYLLSRVTEADLRAGLERETAKLRMNRKFGLVFEEHMPEHVRLYQLPITVGAKVVRREGKGDDVFNVIDLKKGQAHLSHEIDGHWEDTKVDELVVIKKFGEPMYPSLVPVERITRGKEKPYHSVINAENFHALQLLLYCYEGKLDVIYIDPPYNTGAHDWKYNNNYVDSNDQYRHSKWLSMMKRRLILAKRLLTSNGVLIVAIDDYEMFHLGPLIEDIYKEYVIETAVVDHHPQGGGGTNISRTHEYAIFCIPKGTTLVGNETAEDEDEWSLIRSGTATNNYRVGRPNSFYAILVDPESGKPVDVGPALGGSERYPKGKTAEGLIRCYPLDAQGRERVWRYTRDPMLTKIREKKIIRTEKGTFKVIVDRKEKRDPIFSNWYGSAYNAGTHGTSMLADILGADNSFSYPKSLYTVESCIGAVCRNNPHALILDFFAGSGTTLHATCYLNSSDKGSRQCILITNNEVDEKVVKELVSKGIYPGDPRYEKRGICESVTWPRCSFSVRGKRDNGAPLPGEYINGRKMSEGFMENIQYFHLDYLDPNDVAYREKLTDILPMLWLVAGAKGGLESPKKNDQWFIPKKSPFAVLLQETAFAGFKEAIAKCENLKYVFIVTDSEEAYREMCQCLPQKLKTKMLYKSYLENFRINTSHNL